MILWLVSAAAVAGGYQVSLHGQKQIGMGLIGTSLNLDASAAFYNPGALAMMPDRLSIMGGASGIFASTTFEMTQPVAYQAETDNPVGTPFYFYAAGMITDRLAAGLAVNTPYGNSLKWEEGWAGRFLIEEISLTAITIQPTLSYKITNNISVGAGLVYTIGSVDMQRAIPIPDVGEGNINIEGSTSAIGFNAGLLYASDMGLNVGVSYRSRIDMEVDDGDAVFSVPEPVQQFFPDSKVATMLPLPANLDFGLSYQLTPDLMIGMALNYVFWDAYEELSFTFEENPEQLNSTSPREYSNTLIVRLGGQYRVNDALYLRAGGYYDPSPVNEIYFSPETPSLDNLAFTGGLSFYPVPNLSIDFSLLYILGLEGEREFKPIDFGGTYKSSIFIPGLGISYRL